jgi:nitrate/TMAO reductase-like tetraheme cytochrome c subunit
VAAKYGDSIHGRAVSRSGLTVAPTCSNCHGAHDIFSPSNPESRVATTHVPETCGKCHEGIALKFNAGVHGTVLARGNTGAPACQTCHTAHAIQQSESTGWQLSVIGQCGTCHADRVTTFKDTFHGQVTSLGSRAVAGCADCHGPHEILPASDPRSPIAPANRVKTCGKCHEGANENFVKYDPHANKHDRQRSPALFYVSKFMTVLLVGVFSFFGIHTTMWFAREIREGRRKPVRPPEGDTRATRRAAGDRPEGGGDGSSA